ncbi:hypothetical protein [Nonomuraea dietziae]|uniref:hypothetical protein n=1 Tax=Nonomuraea dietziae TaxID=65515 RepID=UPI0033F7641D
MQRGELRTDVDVEVAHDVLFGSIILRLVSGHAPHTRRGGDRREGRPHRPSHQPASDTGIHVGGTRTLRSGPVPRLRRPRGREGRGSDERAPGGGEGDSGVAAQAVEVGVARGLSRATSSSLSGTAVDRKRLFHSATDWIRRATGRPTRRGSQG